MFIYWPLHLVPTAVYPVLQVQWKLPKVLLQYCWHGLLSHSLISNINIRIKLKHCLCLHACVHFSVSVIGWIYTCVCYSVYVCTYACVCACVYVCVCMCVVCIHAYTYICTYMCTYVMCACVTSTMYTPLQVLSSSSSAYPI